MMVLSLLRREAPPILSSLCLCLVVAIGCLVLHAAFPYGMIFADTLGYVDQGMQFHLWEPNTLDWRHMPLFGFFLRFSTLFPYPTTVLFLINAALFALIIVVAFRLAASVFHSERVGFSIAMTLVIWEFLLQKTFFFLHILVADTPFGLLLLLGSLLVMLGWWKRTIPTVYCGFFILGLSAITKPIGVSFIPLWTIVAGLIGFETYRHAARHSARTGMLVSGICFVLLTVLLLGWCTRNALLYGSIRPSAFLFMNIAGRTLPFLEDDDRILPNEKDNAEFIRTVRTYEKNVGTTLNDYASFGIVDGYESPLWYLSRFVPGDVYDRSSKNSYFFRFDPFVVGVSLRIIAENSYRYTSVVLHDYLFMFSPWMMPHVNPDNVPSSRAWYFRQPSRSHMPDRLIRTLYPTDSSLSPERSSLQADYVLRMTNPLRSFLYQPIIRWSTALLTHVLLVVSLWIVWRKGNSAIRQRQPFILLSIITILLSANAIVTYLPTVMVEQPLQRYQLSGIMGLNFVYILWLFAIMRFLLRPMSRVRKN